MSVMLSEQETTINFYIFRHGKAATGSHDSVQIKAGVGFFLKNRIFRYPQRLIFACTCGF